MCKVTTSRVGNTAAALISATHYQRPQRSNRRLRTRHFTDIITTYDHGIAASQPVQPRRASSTSRHQQLLNQKPFHTRHHNINIPILIRLINIQWRARPRTWAITTTPGKPDIYDIGCAPQEFAALQDPHAPDHAITATTYI